MLRTAPTTSSIKVGLTVRAPVVDHPKVLRRAVIATLSEDSSSACLLWEDDALVVAQRWNSQGVELMCTPPRYLARKRLLTPELKVSQEEIDSIVPLVSIKLLLDFECTSDQVVPEPMKECTSNKELIRIWKDRGDQLLLLGDGASALPYYEQALRLTSLLQIGSSVLIREEGFVRIADVDCFDDHNKTVEITMVESQVERVAKEQEILLCLMASDEEALQERILLNLSRCLLQLSETTSVAARRPLYLSRTILGCTMAIAVSHFHDKCSNEVTSFVTERKALLLRCQAQARLRKYKHAIADLQKILTADPQHHEALKLYKSIERQQLEYSKMERKLVKEVCQWVQTATHDPVSHHGSESSNVTQHDKPNRNSQAVALTRLSVSLWLSVVIMVVISWVLPKYTKATG